MESSGPLSTFLEFTDAEADQGFPADTLAPHIDFVSARLSAGDEFLYELQMAGDQLANAGTTPFSLIYTNLVYRTEEFQLQYEIVENNQVEIELIEGSDGIETPGRSTFETTIAMQNGLIKALIPWTAFKGTNGQTPIAGDFIEVISIKSSWAMSGATDPHETVDPPGGKDEIEVKAGTKLYLAEFQPSLTVSSPQPTISANGEETTYAWSVDIRNYEAIERVVSVTGNSPEGVNLIHPAAVVLEPNGNATIRVYAVTPFGHAHGGTRDFQINAEDETASASAVLQIFYLAPPQPAGHHNTVYIQGFKTESTSDIDPTWFSTEEPDELGIGAGSQSMICNQFQQFALGWHVQLSPALSIGVDGIMGEIAELSGTITQNVPLPDAVLMARLSMTVDGQANVPFYAPDEWVTSQPWAGQPNQDNAFSLEIPMPPELDYAPFLPGQNLQLSIAICLTASEPTPIVSGIISDLPVSEFANLWQGAQMTLPLQDFIPQDSPIIGDLQMTTGVPVKSASPGSIVAWEIELMGEASDFEFSVVAPANFDARVTYDESEGLLQADMLVPALAQNGDVLSLIVVGQNEESATELRLVVRVDESLSIVMRDDLVEEVPFLGIVPASLMAFAAAFLARRAKIV
jgi:hypothetical protein